MTAASSRVALLQSPPHLLLRPVNFWLLFGVQGLGLVKPTYKLKQAYTLKKYRANDAVRRLGISAGCIGADRVMYLILKPICCIRYHGLNYLQPP